MNTLFPIEPVYPAGFSYKEEFLSVEEERKLLQVVKDVELHNFTFHGYTANRRVASFGYDYSFDDGSLKKGAAIPAAFHPLVERVATYLQIEAIDFAELLVIEYPPGAVINWHRDAPPFDVIVGISLNADCTFKLRPHDKAQQTRSSVVSIPVMRRSIYILDGSSRTDWQHSTAPVKDTRYSITLRTLRK